MKRLRDSGSCTVSMIWLSSLVPRVAVTRAWVSPRVKREEPWVRGSTPTSQVMGRISSKRRPSSRRWFTRISVRSSFSRRPS